MVSLTDPKRAVWSQDDPPTEAMLKYNPAGFEVALRLSSENDKPQPEYGSQSSYSAVNRARTYRAFFLLENSLPWLHTNKCVGLKKLDVNAVNATLPATSSICL